MDRIWRQLWVAAVICLSAFSAIAANEKMSPAGQALAVATNNPLLVQSLYSAPKRLADNIAPSGAVSVNADYERGMMRNWYIEQQRYGGNLIQAGLAIKNMALVSQGQKVIAWGFAHQAADGSFAGTGDPFHSTSFFVEGAARSILLLDNAGVRDASMSEWKHHLRAAARWMLKPDVLQKGIANNAPYTHRRWLVAAALAESAAATGDHALMDAAKNFADDGLKLQQPDGANPEKGGVDISYHCVGLSFAARYYFVMDDAAMKARVAEMLRKGLDWVAARVDANGNVDLSGNSRTGVEIGHNGQTKKLDYVNVIQAFVYGAQILHDNKYQDIAARIAKAHGWM